MESESSVNTVFYTLSSLAPGVIVLVFNPSLICQITACLLQLWNPKLCFFPRKENRHANGCWCNFAFPVQLTIKCRFTTPNSHAVQRLPKQPTMLHLFFFWVCSTIEKVCATTTSSKDCPLWCHKRNLYISNSSPSQVFIRLSSLGSSLLLRFVHSTEFQTEKWSAINTFGM